MNENEIRAMFEQEWPRLWNAKDVEGMASLYAQDVVLYKAFVKKTLRGLENMTSRFQELIEMSNDAHLSIRDLYVLGDTAIMEINITGTHTGLFLEHEPTGRRFDIDTCLVFKVRDDGKIIQHTTYLDPATLLRALVLVEIIGTHEEAA